MTLKLIKSRDVILMETENWSKYLNDCDIEKSSVEMILILMNTTINQTILAI